MGTKKENIFKNEEHVLYEMAHQVSRTTIKNSHINHYHEILELEIKTLNPRANSDQLQRL